MQQMLLPIIESELSSNLYSHFIRGAKAKFLSTYDDPRSHELLIRLFAHAEYPTKYDQVVATMALRDASPVVRAAASEATLDKIYQIGQAYQAGPFLTGLAWIDDGPGLEEGLKRLAPLLPPAPNLPSRFMAMQMIRPLEIGPGEDVRLLARLQRILEADSFNDWPYKRDWVDRLNYRLGQLKSEKAVPIFLQQLEADDRFIYQYSSYYYVEDALLNIGNDEVIEGLYTLFRATTNEHRKYRYAGLLWELEGGKMLPTLRELAIEDGTRSQTWAWSKLGEVGTPDDLELLRPYSNYWHTDPSNPSTTRGPMAQIRDRHNYDLNGRINPDRPTTVYVILVLAVAFAAFRLRLHIRVAASLARLRNSIFQRR